MDKNKTRIARDHWSNSKEFFLSCLGYAIGLANIWRFPYLCYKYGGGAFLIAYIIAAVFMGMPMFFLEVSLGQFMQKGPIKCFNIVPLMKGVGFGSVLMIFYSLFYILLVMAWGLFYFFESFTTSELPWATCGNWWNSDSCITLKDLVNHYQPLGNNISNYTFVNDSRFSVEENFNNYILQKSSGIDAVGSMQNWKLMLCFISTWLLCYLIIYRGVKISGKVVYFTVIFPYVILVILVIRGCTLEGAGNGLKFYLVPNFTMLATSEVWVQASSQVLFSFGVCFSVLTAFGSYNDFHSDCYKHTIALVTASGLTSFLAGFCVFSVLGHMAHATNKNLADVVSSGPGLVFQTYPAALSLMPGSQVWSVLFFFMLLLIGIDSIFACTEGAACAIGDYFPKLIFDPKKKQITLFILCASTAISSIPLTFGCGIYIFEIFNTYSVSGICLFTLVFFECVTVAYVYGVDKFLKDAGSMIGYSPTCYIKWCYLVIIPSCTLALLTVSFVQHKPLTLNGYVYPPWAYAFGWCLTFSSILMIPIVAVYSICKAPGVTLKEKVKSSIQPKYSQHILELRTTKLSMLTNDKI